MVDAQEYATPMASDVDVDDFFELETIDTVTHAPDDLDDHDLDWFIQQGTLHADISQLFERAPVAVPQVLADVDWDNVADAGWTLADPPARDGSFPVNNEKKVANTNVTRRANEEERLRKFSWERHEVVPSGNKRVRYIYTNINDGSTATSLREALRSCNMKRE